MAIMIDKYLNEFNGNSFLIRYPRYYLFNLNLVITIHRCTYKNSLRSDFKDNGYALFGKNCCSPRIIQLR